MKSGIAWTTACLLATLGLVTARGETDSPSSAPKRASPVSSLTFEQHVRPVFKAMCFHCHGEDDKKNGNLDLRLVRLMQAGGDSGPAIVPGDVASSLLWQRIESDEMPEGSKKLSSEQKSLVKSWIDSGALTARPEPENVEAARFTVEELEHWAFQLVKKPVMPRPEGYALSTPVDGFIARRLAERGVPFSRAANRRTLIRRITFDLTGIPPTPEEVDAFLEDSSPDVYPKLVDRLLTSPQFGVRWGRHWLDVAGFAESNGGSVHDTPRPHAWRYRNYVIDTFNANKPIDAFIREQLAGDEMIEGDLDFNNPRHLELLTATGFLRMAPDPTQQRNELADRNMATAQAVEVISSTLLGLTVSCAQCHDHKYDPIGIDDYYGFRAVFDPVFALDNWQQPDTQLVDMTTDETRARFNAIEAQAREKEEEIKARRRAHCEKILEKKLALVPEETRETVRAANLKPGGERTAEEVALLKQHPVVQPLSHIIGLLVEYDGAAFRKFQDELQGVAAIRATRPQMRVIMATRERPGVVPQSAVFFRGNPRSPKREVSPGELTVLKRSGREVRIPTNEENRPTTGRRTAYARQLTDGNHPLTARVFVNRVWMHHMGRGLVATPGDFGILGAHPSHPELLDWLADDFVRHGWDQKRLHRWIVLSTTYQQQSTRTAVLEAVDAENELLGRMHLRRLEAEAIRDAILSTSGQIDLTIGGASVPVIRDGAGKAVIGGSAGDSTRRSVFIQVQRNLPMNMLATFDQPAMDPNCKLRQPSTVATQSLWFLNDSLIVQHADNLTRLVYGVGDIAPEERVRQLYARLFTATISESEQQSCLEFLASQTEHFRLDPDAAWQEILKKSPEEAEQRAFASLCQTLLASNRFLYVD
jgi:hypothetical protein